MPEKANQFDVLFVIALPEEMIGIQPSLPDGTLPISVEGFTLHKHIVQQDDGTSFSCGFWIVWKMGPEEILLQLPELLHLTFPTFVINVGIAGMLSGDAKIGDIVIADELDYYTYRGALSGKAKEDQNINLGGHSVPIHHDSMLEARGIIERSPDIVNSIKAATVKFIQTLDKTKIDRIRHLKLLRDSPELHFGPIASGPFVNKSKPFKDRLLQRNRNLLCIEMESAGVAMVMNKHLPTHGYLIVKGVSDPGDDNKKAVDGALKGKNRLLAVQNAFDLALSIVRNRDRKAKLLLENCDSQSAPQLRNLLSEQISKTFLPKPYRECAKECTNFHDHTFSDLSEVFNIAPRAPLSSPVEQLVAVLDASTDSPTHLFLSGRPGTGKTSLVSLLYLHCFHLWKIGIRKTFPIFICIRPAVGFWAEQRPELKQDEQLARIQYTLDICRRLAELDSSSKFDVFFDSGEAEAPFVNQIRTTVREFVQRHSANSLSTGRAIKSRFGAIEYKHYKLEPVARTRPALEGFCSKFCRLINTPCDPNILMNFLWSRGLEDVDLFDASVAVQVLESDRGTQNHEAFVLQDYANLRLQQLGVPDSQIAKEKMKAGLFCIDRERRIAEQDIESLELPARALARAHPRIHDYLVASMLVNALDAYKEGVAIDDALDCVYPQRINSLAKELMCVNGLEKRCVENALLIVGGKHEKYRAKAFAAYLAGRARNPQLRERVSGDLLKQIREAREFHELANADTDRDELLYARTIYISLSYLGNYEIQIEYVDALISKKSLDEINRGFHLEYFGDQKFHIDLPLQNRDRLHDCPLTFERLYFRVCSQTTSPLFEVELQTFLSLALQRHAIGALSGDFRLRVEEVLKNDRVRSMVKSDRLADFLFTVDWCLSESVLTAAGIVNVFLNTKIQPRTGWLKRGVTPCESVADHSFGALMIAQMLLPENASIHGYSKDRIIRMLMIHDMAEAITGDIPPDMKGESQQEEEMKVFRSLRAVGVIPGLASQEVNVELYEEFEAKKTINALVARDIDKLEMLFQFYRYVDSNEIDPHTHPVDKELQLSKILKTEIGRTIHAQIIKWREPKRATQTN